MVAGQVLLLFGFAEVMRSRRAQGLDAEEPKRAHPDRVSPVADEAHAGIPRPRAPAEAPPR